MNMYPTPVDGTYSHKTPRFDRTFNVCHVEVQVLGESKSMYLIGILTPVGNHRTGDRINVRKHNVWLHRQATQPREYDYTNAYWNND